MKLKMLKNNKFVIFVLLCLVILCFKTIRVYNLVQGQAALESVIYSQSPKFAYSSTDCETIIISCERDNFTTENVKNIKIDAEIKNCLATTFKLSIDPNIGNKDSPTAWFSVDIKKHEGNQWKDIKELDNDIDFFNLKGFVLLQPNESYCYSLSPFLYLYPSPEKGLYQIKVYFYNRIIKSTYQSNVVEFVVI